MKESGELGAKFAMAQVMDVQTVETHGETVERDRRHAMCEI